MSLKMDLEKSYPALFELLWYSQMPCFDMINVTSAKNHQFGEQLTIMQPLSSPIQTLAPLGMLKWCAWKGRPLSCSSIFTMFPTDRGMCCSFNKQRAEDMFNEGKYRDDKKDVTEVA